MTTLDIRDYRPEDRDAVRRICFETGLMGESIASQYGDQPSFADMFSSYYTDSEPENALVCVRGERVVGYMLSALDSRKVPSFSAISIRHGLLRGSWFRAGTRSFYRRTFFDMVGDLVATHAPKVDYDRFPSHTHNNLLPEGRGAGVALRCFYTVFDRLKERGSRGLHGDVYANNAAMIGFGVSKLGYVPHGVPYPVPGVRDAAGQRLYVQRFTRSLEDWVVGAWRNA